MIEKIDPDMCRKISLECNSYSRLPTLLSMAFSLENASDWLKIMGESWTTCDNISEYRFDIEDTFLEIGVDLSKPCHYFMDAHEIELLSSLPDEVEIWRGCYSNNKWGISWSLNRDVAESIPFLNRYRQQDRPLVIRGTIQKNNVFALKLDRDEKEILCFVKPKHISTRTARQGGGAKKLDE